MNNNYNGFYPYQNYYPNMNQGMSFRNMGAMASAPRSGGLLSRLFSGGASSLAPGIASGVGTATKSFSFSGLLNGASKTLGVINQAIPVFYQVKPIWNNAKTMFRVAKAINSKDNVNQNNNVNTTNNSTNASINKNNEPTFFQ